MIVRSKVARNWPAPIGPPKEGAPAVPDAMMKGPMPPMGVRPPVTAPAVIRRPVAPVSKVTVKAKIPPLPRGLRI